MRYLLILCIAIPALLAQKPGGMAGVGGSGSAAPSGVAAGDLSGTYPNPTVVKINGTALSGLATGLLKNTTTTGVPSIAVAGTDLIGGVGNLTTVGSVPYVSASGILNQDAGQLHWDATNNKLGIGTNAPAYSLSVYNDINGQTTISLDNPNAGTSASALMEFKNGALGANDRLLTGVTGTGFTAIAGWTDTAIFWATANLSGGIAIAASAGSINFETGGGGSAWRRMVIDSTGRVGIGTTTPGNTLSVNGRASANLFGSETNCSSSAGPAVCAAAAAGSVIIPAAGTDVTVNTTAVTANSQIFAIFDQSLGTKLGVTCNSTTANPHIGARVAGTSFTIHANVSPVTNPACFSYFIIN